jgi:integrase/recombinase XerD
MTSLAPILQRFFTDHLITQRKTSPHTVRSYKDTFRLLLTFATQRTGTPPWKLELGQLDADLIGAFLTERQRQHGNSAATRNTRLAAIHSLFGYAAMHAPQDAATIQRVMAILWALPTAMSFLLRDA